MKCLIFHFRFLLLSLEPDHNCGYDYVEVRDGEGLSSPVIGRFCGDQLPPPMKSSGSGLHVLFSSDGYHNFNGFVLIFQESAGRYSHYEQSCVTPLTPRKPRFEMRSTCALSGAIMLGLTALVIFLLNVSA